MPLLIVERRRKQRKLTALGLLGAVLTLASFFWMFNEQISDMVRVGPPVVIHDSPEAEPPDPDLDIDIENIEPEDIVIPDIVVNETPDDNDPFAGWRPSEMPGGDDLMPVDDAPVEATLVPVEPIEVVIRMTNKATSDIARRLFGADDADPSSKAAISGARHRISGHSAIAVLDLPGIDGDPTWSSDDLEAIADFMTRNTEVNLRLGARAISFVGPGARFDTWLADARERGTGRRRSISSSDPEIDALEALADAMPAAADGDYERFRSRVRRTMADYLRVKFDARIDPLDDDWWAAVDTARLRPYHKHHLDNAQEALQTVWRRRRPTGQEARPIYLMLRQFEMMNLPVLFCEPRGVLTQLHPETVELLRTYVNNGGFIYFANTADINRARSVRGLISSIIDENLRDTEGEKVLARMMAEDQEVTGYEFRPPEPSIAHPWAFFPMSIPRRTDVTLTVYNRRGEEVFREVLRDMAPGDYFQKYRHYRWHATDTEGNPLESGYYIYRIESDLACRTGPIRVSRLRRLPNARHRLFSACFNISEVPSTAKVSARDLAYGEEGVFGVTVRGRLAICYTEGYREKDALRTQDAPSREASLQWLTNVVMYALAEGSIAR